MDAANPLCRWLMAAGLAAAFGCSSTAADRAPTGRGQLPDPVAPLPPAQVAPTAAPAAPVAGSPVAAGSPAGPVVGRPASGDPASVAVQPVAYAANQTDLLKNGVPQIKVVALVGATGLVTDQEVIEAVRQRPDLAGLAGPALRAKEQELYAAMLRKVIERELILDDMYTKLKKNGKGAMIDEIKEFAGRGAEQSLRTIRREVGLDTDEKFQMWLRAQGLSEPVIRRQIERQTMADEYVRSAIREKGRGPGLAEVRAYYDRNPSEFKTDDRVKWLDIFVSANRHPTVQAAADHAEMIRKQAAAGGDFSALAKQYDNGVAAGTGGVGIGTKRGEIQPADVEPAVWALKPGEVSNVIPTPSGYHIVKVVERDYSGVKPFDAKVQAEIRDKLLKQQRETEYRRVVEDLWRKGAVRVIE